MEELKAKPLLFPDSGPRECAASAPAFLPKGIGAKTSPGVRVSWEAQLFPLSQKTCCVQTSFHGMFSSSLKIILCLESFFPVTGRAISFLYEKGQFPLARFTLDSEKCLKWLKKNP